MKYYVSDPKAIEDAAGGDLNFQSEELTAKRAPFSSYSELYALPEWPDDIVNLIRSEFTIHGALMIDLNKITNQLLKILIPDILPEDIDEFFKWKNDPKDPKHFNDLSEFKNYIVNIGNIMTSEEFEERFKRFQEQGLQFGPTPTLFKIIVGSTVNSATYTLTAYVTIPAQPVPRIVDPVQEYDDNGNPIPPNPNDPDPNDPDPNDPDPNDPDANDLDAEQPTQLLDPRIVEIIIS